MSDATHTHTTPSQLRTAPFDIYGPIVIGMMVEVFGLGMLIILLYFDSGSRGGRDIKILILLVLLINIAQTASDCSRVIKITVLHAGDLSYYLFIRQRPEFIVSPICSVILATTTQAFLIRRIMQFGLIITGPVNRLRTLQVWILGLALFAGAGLSFSCGLGSLIRIWQLENIYRARRGADHMFELLATIQLSTSTAVDIMISGIMIYHLRAALRTGEDRHGIVSTLTKLALSSGAVVTTLQIAGLIAYLHTETVWSSFPLLFISKVYSMTLVAAVSQPQRTAKRRASQAVTAGSPTVIEARHLGSKELHLSIPDGGADRSAILGFGDIADQPYGVALSSRHVPSRPLTYERIISINRVNQPDLTDPASEEPLRRDSGSSGRGETSSRSEPMSSLQIAVTRSEPVVSFV
ncbi:hypothetical protein IAU60_005253 [Kwoniella sp. DSM 27419]